MSKAEKEPEARMTTEESDQGRYLERILTAPQSEISTSVQYGTHRELWLIKVNPLPWSLSWEHEGEANVVDANGKLVAVVHTGVLNYGHAGEIAGIFLAALRLAADQFAEGAR